RPLQGAEAAASGRLDRELVALTASLATRASASLAARRYALPWLIHLVGDAHQPLHASTRGDDDETISNPFNPRKRRSSLHAFWDDLPGPPWLRGERLNRVSAALLAAYPRPAAADSSEWLAESWQLARERAYPPAGAAVIDA